MTTERAMTPQEVCAKAAELIRQHGWMQGRFGDKRNGYCLQGALNFAYDGRPRGCRVPLEVVDLIGVHLPPSRWGNYVAWNDDPSRTIDEVLAVLDAAGEETT